MANFPQSKKRARQAEKRRAHNVGMQSAMRTYVKRLRQAASENEPEQAQAAFKLAVPAIDKLANKKLLHKRTAARYKKRLSGRLKKMAKSSS